MEKVLGSCQRTSEENKKALSGNVFTDEGNLYQTWYNEYVRSSIARRFLGKY